MGHELIPRSGAFSPAEVVRMLKREFAYVDVDAAGGLEAARAQADFIERAAAHIFPDHAAALAHASRLRALEEEDAFIVHFGDRSDLAVRIRLLPGGAIQFGYAGREEELSVRHLVERCARALESDIVLF